MTEPAINMSSDFAASSLLNASEFTNGDDGDYGDVDSLPESEPDSDTTSGLSYSDDNEESDAEREWRESMQQLEMLLTMVLIPFAGKYYGRKFAYWGWAKFMEWKYPVKIEITNKAMFKASGVVEAAAPL